MNIPSPNAMGFYHRDTPTLFAQATRFAGESGSIATLPDIIDARLANPKGGYVWNNYFGTMSAEYFGYSKAGTRLLIVAHSVGPLATLKGQLAARDFVAKDVERRQCGGRISAEEFLKLESGHYGEVSIVPYDVVHSFGEYPFTQLRASVAARHPLVHARFGPRTEEYIALHRAIAQGKEAENGTASDDPFILTLAQPNGASYEVGGFGRYPRTHPYLDAGDGALAHSLHLSQLTKLSHTGSKPGGSIVSEVSPSDPGELYRVIAIKSGAAEAVEPDFGGDVRKYLLRFADRLTEPVALPTPATLYHLMVSEGRWFTQVAHTGQAVASGEAEYIVTSCREIGTPKTMVTEVTGYYGVFRFDYEAVQKLAPEGANAFRINTPEITNGGKTHTSRVQFFRASVDTSRRLWKADRLAADYETLLELSEIAA